MVYQRIEHVFPDVYHYTTHVSVVWTFYSPVVDATFFSSLSFLLTFDHILWFKNNFMISSPSPPPSLHMLLHYLTSRALFSVCLAVLVLVNIRGLPIVMVSLFFSCSSGSLVFRSIGRLVAAAPFWFWLICTCTLFIESKTFLHPHLNRNDGTENAVHH